MDLKRYPLTTETDERLIARLTEECSEVIKCVCKIQRFGWQGNHPPPDAQGFQRNNSLDLRDEMKDVLAVWNEIMKRELLTVKRQKEREA